MKMITQTMIGAYERCRRFYYLKYVRELDWPAKIRDRESLRHGADFHLLVRQLIMGLPQDALVYPADDPSAESRVGAWLRSAPLSGFEQVWAEREVTALFEDTLLLGKFDALAVSGNRLTVFDWKTSEQRPETAVYAASPQTRLYRWLLKTAAPRLLGKQDEAIPADHIEMVYWFPAYPDQPVRLPYSEQAYEEDQTWLKMVIRELSPLKEEEYPKTDKKRRCGNCGYNAYCHPEEIALQRQAEAFSPKPEEPLSAEDLQTEFEFPDFPPPEESDAVSY